MTPAKQTPRPANWVALRVSPLSQDSVAVTTPYDVTSGATIDAFPIANALDKEREPETVKREAMKPATQPLEEALAA
ncbi:hypothetical protein GCM10009425_46610 [Pseudomonas asuensis]|jgi:hypothetical protein|uniref:Uncharacterized protein n=1 Tax=Pseudomonas asuensis TaxID=1825787 RepID=A0ABQ2H4M0_9PSED|nr:hypothetical protein GCM10009425_46610 [Pseudomonas asuensis]